MKLRLNILAPVAFAALAVGCSEWMTPENVQVDPYGLTEVAKDEAYYEALRAYKASDHAVSFGWFSEWGEGGVSTKSMLTGVPDSMDIISLWNNSRNLSQSKKDDLKFVQDVKGTKVLVCTFIQYVGQGFTPAEYHFDTSHPDTNKVWNAYWGWDESSEDAMKAALAKYAKAIADTIDYYGYDGLDIDFEPNVDGVPNMPLDENPIRVGWFLDELSKYLGPKSGSGKMLVIDGELNHVPEPTCTYFDYFVAQAYSVSSGSPSPNAGNSASNLDSRLSTIVSRFSEFMSAEEVTNKFIVTENLESAMDCLKGGYFWTDSRGKWSKDVMPSLVGFADWKPANGFRKGGFGGYRFSNEAANNPPYKWMKKAIQQQNPSDPSKLITDEDYKPAE